MDVPNWLPSLVLCIGVLLISINFWYLVYMPQKYKEEGFDSNQYTITNLINSEKLPTDDEVAIAYRTVLVYMKSNTLKSLKIIADFTTRVYGNSIPVPDSFDPRTIMDNYRNPITGI